jgi:autotransporter-associated beta strand protein
MKTYFFKLSLLFVLVAMPGASLGVTRTWTNGNGNSQWSTATNWSGAPLNEPSSSDPVIFPSTVPLSQFFISLSSGEQASSLSVNNFYHLQSGSLTLATGSVSTASGFTAFINSVIAGTAGLSLTGGGRLELRGVNTFTGAVNVGNGCTLWIDADSRLGSAGNSVTLNGGELIVASSITTSRTFSAGALGGTIQPVGGTTLTLNSGFAANSNPLSLRGAGSIWLNGTSNRSGSTFIYDCTVRMNNSAGLGSGAVVVGSESGIGKLEIPDGINFIRPITLNPGGALRGGGTLGVVNGPCTISSTARLIGGVSSTFTLRLGNVGSALSGGPGTLAIVEGPGAVQTSVPNDYQGEWRVDSGTLRLVSQNNGLGTGTSPIVVNGGGTLHLSTVTFQRDIALNSGSKLMFDMPGQVYNQVTIAPGAMVTLSLNNSGTETLGINPNAITGGTGGSTISVTGLSSDAVLALNQPSDYVGKWSVSGGTVLIDDDANLGDTSNILSLSGGTLRVNTNVTLTRTVVPNGGTLRAEDPSTQLMLTSALGAGAGTLYTAGTGTVELQAPSSRTGDTQIDGAVLRVEDRNALGTDFTGMTQVGSWTGHPPEISPTLEIGDVRLFKDIRLEGDNATIRGTGGGVGCFGSIEVTQATSGRLETGSSPSDYFTLGVGTLYGGTDGSSLTVAGAGRVVLTTGSSYVGEWYLWSGTLEISVDDRLGPAANAVHLLGGTLATTMNSFVSTSRSFSAAGGALAPAVGSTLTLNSPLLPTSGELTKLGAGTLALTAGSSRSGPTTVSAGVLQVSNSSGSATGSGSVTVAGGGTLRGAGFIAGAILNDGAVAPGASAGILTIDDFYAQSASGSLNVEIGGTTPGTNHDRLVVSGAASLSGTMNLTRINGFEPQVGDSFVVLTCGSRSGEFDQVTGISAGPGKVFRVQYNPTDVALVVKLSGDLNNDNVLDTMDVDPFVLALTDLTSYQQQYPSGDPSLGDMNHDGDINGSDIGPFIACLVDGSCP